MINKGRPFRNGQIKWLESSLQVRKRFGGFLLPIFQESNFRNKQSVVQYPQSYIGRKVPWGKSIVQITHKPTRLISQKQV